MSTPSEKLGDGAPPVSVAASKPGQELTGASSSAGVSLIAAPSVAGTALTGATSDAGTAMADVTVASNAQSEATPLAGASTGAVLGAGEGADAGSKAGDASTVSLNTAARLGVAGAAAASTSWEAAGATVSSCRKAAAKSTSLPCIRRASLHVLMSTDGQRSRSLRIDAKVTRLAGGSAGGSAVAGKGMTWPGEEKGDPDEKENDDSRVGGGGSSVACLLLSPIFTPRAWLHRSSKGLALLAAGELGDGRAQPSATRLQCSECQRYQCSRSQRQRCEIRAFKKECDSMI